MLERGVRIVVEFGRRHRLMRWAAVGAVCLLFVLIAVQNKWRRLAVLNRREFLRRFTAVVLSVCMVSALLPIQVWAAETQTITGELKGYTASQDTVWTGGNVSGTITVEPGVTFTVQGTMNLIWGVTFDVKEGAVLLFRDALVQRDSGSSYKLILSGAGETVVEGDTTWMFDITQRQDLTVRPGAVLRLGKALIVEKDITVSGGGTITRGVAANQLLSVKKDSGATLTLENITVDGGAVWSGGVGADTNTGQTAGAALLYVGIGGTAVLNNGAVLQNNHNASGGTAVNGMGGGVYIAGTASSGGALFMNTGSVIRDNFSGVVKNNEAAGGVTVGPGGADSQAAFVMTGGEIAGCRGQVGGVSLQSGRFSVSGTPVVKGNIGTGADGGSAEENVFVSSGLSVTVAGALANGAELGASCRRVTDTQEALFAQGAEEAPGYRITETDAEKISCDSPKCQIYLDEESGGLYLRENLRHVIFKSMDGSVEYKMETVYAGDKVEFYIPETPEGYSPFCSLSWTTEAGGGGDVFDFSLPVTENTTIYAMWKDTDGTKENPYQIVKVEQLEWIQAAVNAPGSVDNYKDKYFVLEKDLSFSPTEGIGTESNPFEGHFDGNGHSLELSLHGNPGLGAESGYTALFNCLGSSGSVSGLTVTGKVTVETASSTDVYAAGIAALSRGRVENCVNAAEISVSGSGSVYAGGAAAYVSGGAVLGCVNQGPVSAVGSETYVGGVLGAGAGTELQSCENQGAVSGEASKTGKIGGIAGAFTGGELMDCGNSGNVVSRVTRSGSGCFNYTGGVAGCGAKVQLQRCRNSGAVEVKKTSRVTRLGGVIGFAEGMEINGCENSGDVNSDISGCVWEIELAAGGLAGELSGSMKNSVNSGGLKLDFTSYDTSYYQVALEGGGLAGYADGGIFNCYNTGALNGRINIAALNGAKEPSQIRLAGLVCRLNNVYEEKLENCYSTADFTAVGDGKGAAGITTGAFGLVGSYEKKVSYCFWKSGGLTAVSPFGQEPGEEERRTNASFADADGALSQEIAFPETDSDKYNNLLDILNAYASENAGEGLAFWRAADGVNDGYPTQRGAALPSVTAKTEDSVTIRVVQGQRYAITETEVQPEEGEWFCPEGSTWRFAGLSMDTAYYIWAQKIDSPEDVGYIKVYSAKGIIDLSATDAAVDYDGEEHTVAVQVNTPTAGAVVTYLNPQTDSYEEQAPGYSQAGEYTVQYRAEAPGYEDKEGSVKLTIRALPLELISGAALTPSKEYDGTTKAAVAYAGSLDVSGVLAADRAQLRLTASAFYADPGVGENKSVTVIYGLEGSAADNYTAPKPDGGYAAKILPRTVTVDGAVAVEREYDKTRTVEITGGAIEGLVQGDGDRVGLAGDEAFGTLENAGAGEDKAVTAAGFRLTGSGKENYSLRQPEGLTVTILPRTLGSGETYVAGISVRPIADQIYTGGPVSPSAVVLDGADKLSEGVDFEMVCQDNVGPGDAVAQITGKGNYRGTITAGFVIRYGSPAVGSYTVDVSGRNDGGWYREAFAITAAEGFLITADPVRGPWAESVTVDAETPAEGSSAAVYLRRDGETAISELILPYKLDRTKPVLEDRGISGIPNIWTKDGATITLKPQDGISGVAGVTAALTAGGISTPTAVTGPDQTGGYTFTAEENGVYHIAVTDAAGNTADQEISIAKIDKTPPDVLFSPELTEGKWNGEITVTVSADDRGASSAHEISLALKVDGTPVANPARFAASGIYRFEVSASDAAGNVAHVVKSVRVDTVIDDFEALVGKVDTTEFEQVYGALSVYMGYTDDQRAHIRASDAGNAAWDTLEDALTGMNGYLVTEIQRVLAAWGPTVEDILRAEILYDLLSTEYKSQISAASMKQLAVDRGAAQRVIGQVGAADSYEEQKAAVFSARGYDALTEAQKKLADMEPQLPESIASMREDVTAVDGVLELLAKVTRPFGPETKLDIEAARAARDLLSAGQKGLTPEYEDALLDQLIDMKERAESVEREAAALPEPEGYQSALDRQIRTAREHWTALSADEKAMLAEGTADRLNGLYEAMIAGEAEAGGTEGAAAEAVRELLRVVDDPDRTAEDIRRVRDAYEALNSQEKTQYDGAVVRDGYRAVELRKQLTDDLAATEPLVLVLTGFLKDGGSGSGGPDGNGVRVLTPEDFSPLGDALDEYEGLSQRRQRLADRSAGRIVGMLQELYEDAVRGIAMIEAIPLHDQYDAETGAPAFSECGVQTSDSHSFDEHRKTLEAAAVVYQGLSTGARQLISFESAQRLALEYKGLMDYLNYSCRIETPSTVVELYGLSQNLELSGTAGAGKTVITAEGREEACEIRPAAPPEKSLLLSLNIQILARLFDDAAADPAVDLPFRTLYLQPKPGQYIVVRMRIPKGCKTESVEIWHVLDSGALYRIRDFRIVEDDDGVYAVFETDHFSHFLLYGKTEAGDDGSSHSSGKHSGTGKPVENPAEEINAVFSDIGGHWAEENIRFAAGNGLMSGLGDGTFRPEEYATRAMAVTVLWNMAGRPQPENLNHFRDVAAGSWYAEAVNWAAEQDIVAGVGAGLFDGERPASRQELAVMFYHYACSISEEARSFSTSDAAETARISLSLMAAKQSISDLFQSVWTRSSTGAATDAASERLGVTRIYEDWREIAPWAAEAVAWCAENGIMTGRPGNRFAAEDTGTRAELASVIRNFSRWAEKQEIDRQ